MFVDVPHRSISYIYQSIGCQHSLQPSSNDFDPPSIPALTNRGFIRWESIETLLQPEEHVPYLQYAVENFALKNPETGELYPTVLPKEVFPLQPDAALEAWHKACGQRLRQQATPERSPNDDQDDAATRPNLPPRSSNIRSGYNHVRAYPPSSNGQHAKDYFTSRPVYQHVSRESMSGHPGIRRSATQGRRTRLGPKDAEDIHDRPSRTRRRSVPDNYYPTSPISPNDTPPAMQENLRPQPDNHTRRHSHPRQYPQRSRSTSTTSTDDGAATSDSTSPRMTPKPPQRGPPRSHPGAGVNSRPREPPGSAARAIPISPVLNRARVASGNTQIPSVQVDPRSASYGIPIDARGRQLYPEEVLSRHDSRSGLHGRHARRESLENHHSGGDERDRDKVRRDERPTRLAEMRNEGSVRSGSHDGRYGGRDRVRERERDRDSHTDREDHRGRERSPAEERKKVKKRWYEFS